MLKSYFTAWKKAFKYQGRSTRKDYWSFQLISFFIALLFALLSLIQGVLIFHPSDNYFFEILYYFITILIFILAAILFGSMWVALPLNIRRIRDVGMKWQWIFLALMPYLGIIFVLIFLTRNSVEEINGKKYFPKY